MTIDAPKPPAGWYPTPSGEQRYWDGESWLALPAPDDAAAPTESRVENQEPKRRPRRGQLIALAVVVACLAVAGGSVAAWKLTSDQVAAAEQAETDRLAEQAADDAQRADAVEKRKAERAAAAEDVERAARAESVTGIQDAVKKMAEGHSADGLIEGPILSVDCSPVNGGSTDDLTEQTTVFECFVATKENSDGTFSGYFYNATMNWSTGSYTYSLGAP